MSHEQLKSCIVEKEMEIQRLEQTIKHLRATSSSCSNLKATSTPTIKEWFSSLRNKVTRGRTRSVGNELDAMSPPLTKHYSCVELSTVRSQQRMYPEFSSSFDSKRTSREPSLVETPTSRVYTYDELVRMKGVVPAETLLCDEDCMEIYGVPRQWLSILSTVDRLESSRRHLLTPRQHRFNRSQHL